MGGSIASCPLTCNTPVPYCRLAVLPAGKPPAGCCLAPLDSMLCELALAKVKGAPHSCMKPVPVHQGSS